MRVPGGREQSTIINTLVLSQDGVESHEVVDKQTNFSVTDTHTDTHRPFYNKIMCMLFFLVLLEVAPATPPRRAINLFDGTKWNSNTPLIIVCRIKLNVADRSCFVGSTTLTIYIFKGS